MPDKGGVRAARGGEGAGGEGPRSDGSLEHHRVGGRGAGGCARGSGCGATGLSEDEEGEGEAVTRRVFRDSICWSGWSAPSWIILHLYHVDYLRDT